MPELESPSEPSNEMLESWFKKYGALFRIEILDKWYLFRYLTRREFKFLLMIEDEGVRQDELCETVVLWPPNFSILPTDKAGISESISKEVLKVSGFGTDVDQRFKQYEENITGNIEPQMEAVIEYVFGSNGGKFDQYQDWSQEEIFDTYQRAMWILRTVEAKQHLVAGPEKKQKVISAAEAVEMTKHKSGQEERSIANMTMAEAEAKHKKKQREDAMKAAVARKQTMHPYNSKR